jgi:hypothetical protein
VLSDTFRNAPTMPNHARDLRSEEEENQATGKLGRSIGLWRGRDGTRKREREGPAEQDAEDACSGERQDAIGGRDGAG